MTVAEIKEYIDEQKSIAFLVKDDEVLSTESVVATLDIISSMLDELETPIELDTKKYFEQIDKLVDREMAQYLADQMKRVADQMKRVLKQQTEKGSKQ